MNFSTLKTTILLAALTGLLVIIGYGLGGNAGMVIGFLLAGTMNLGSYWFADRIAMKMAGAREISEEEAPELHAIVAQLAQASDLSVDPSTNSDQRCVRYGGDCYSIGAESAAAASRRGR